MPGIIEVGGANHDGVLRGIQDHLVRFVGIQERVETHPDLRPRYSEDGRRENPPASRRHRTRFFDPAFRDPFERFDRLSRLIRQPSKHEATPIRTVNDFLLNIEQFTEIQDFDLIRQELMHRFTEGLLDFPRTEDPLKPLGHMPEEPTGELPRVMSDSPIF